MVTATQSSYSSVSSNETVLLKDKDYPIGPADLDRLISAIYDGITETPPWNGALEVIRELMKAAHVTLMLRPPSQESTGVMINAGEVDEQATVSYETHFFAIDPFVGLPEGKIISAEDLLGKDKWLKSAMYLEYLSPLGIRHLLGADITTDDGIQCRLRVTRPPEGKAFSSKDRALVQALLPHLIRAIGLHAQMDYLECERQLYSGAMERLLLGMVSIDQHAAIIQMNPEAERILAEKDGIQLTHKGLKASRHSENQELQRLLQEAIAGGISDAEPTVVEAMSITREFDRSRLGIVVRTIPMGEWSEAGKRPAAVVFLRDPDYNSAEPIQEVVQRVFGLTRMEAALAVLLARGLTLDEAAEELNVRRNTARTHLRSIFGKTGVSRQTMLVRLLLQSVISLG
jgi:DNA-binding CsgD family transcriptional regulator